MSHEIESMVYAGEVPWHGLGKKIPDTLSPSEMLKIAELDYTVRKEPLYRKIGDQLFESEKSSILVRDSDNKELDTITNGWEPVQNAEAFGFFDEFIREGNMKMHTAGSLREGKIVWALAKMNYKMEIVKDDVIDNYLLFTNYFEYGKSTDVRATPIRVVCNNTLSLALGTVANKMARFSHRNKFDPIKAKQTLAIATDKMDSYKEAAQFLAKKRYNEKSVVNFFNEVFPTNGVNKELPSKAAVQALDVLEKQPGAQYAEGSWWQAYNAVTYLTDHLAGTSTDTRLQSAWYGHHSKTKVNALKQAVKYAEAA